MAISFFSHLLLKMPVANKPRFIVYSLEGCPWCVQIVRELRKRKFRVKVVKVLHGQAQPRLPDGRTRYNFPQCFMSTGGYEQTLKFISSF